MTKESNQERTFEFTDRALRGLPTPPKPQQLDYFDGKTRGLGLRISYGGRRTFFLLYSDERKKRQRLSLGEYGQPEYGKLSLAEARKRAKIQLGIVAQARDPAGDARAVRQAPTVETLAADFIAMQRKGDDKRGPRKTVNRQERLLALNVLPAIGGMKARDVKRDDIKRLMSKITDRGAPVQTNRVHEVVRTMFNFGLEEDVYGLENNPADHLGRHRNPEPERERNLDLDEIKRYWTALEQASDEPADALRLCLLTAARQGNVLGMRLDQLALEDHLWTCPASTTKTSKTYHVPLSDMAVGIIRNRVTALKEAETARAAKAAQDPRPVTWIFPAKGRDGPASLPLTRRPHLRACERAGIKSYRIHDHRHTFAHHCEQMSIPRLIWDGILGHIDASMAARYAGFDFPKERRICMEKWADRIAAAVADNVVTLDEKRA